MENEVKKPVCPYCNKEMIPTKYVGYYEQFTYWDCECGELKAEEINRGSYA